MKKIFVCFLLLLLLNPFFGYKPVQAEENTPEAKLYINEVVSSNKRSHIDSLYGVRDWIELYNGSDTDISLKNLFISDKLSSSGKLYSLPDVTVPAGGYTVLLCGGDDEKSGLLPFNLSRDGESLSLVNSHHVEICTVQIPALVQDVSYARREDGTYGFCALPTPGAPNTGVIADTCPAVSDLHEEKEKKEKPVYLPLSVTGVVTNPNTDFCDSCAIWMDTVVLTNPNDTAVDLAGYCLNDKENYVKKGALTSYILEPGASVTVFCCGENCPEKETHCCIDLGLSKSGDTLYLYAPDKSLIEKIDIPALDKGATYTKLSDGSWTVVASPAAAEEQKADAPGALPLSGGVFINELLYKNKYSVTDSYGDRSDFVELYNDSSAPVSLKGWYLSDSEKRLTKWAFPDITIESGAYLVVFLSGRESTDYELHASFSVSKGETLYLYDSNRNLADSLQAYTVPSNISLGREDGTPVMYGAPTPGNANGHAWPLTEQE